MNIMKSYFNKYGLIRHQIEGFNDFVLYGIQHVIDDEPDIVIGSDKYYFKSVSFSKPTYIKDGNIVEKLTPRIARENNLTYDFPVYVDVYKNDTKVGNVNLCNFPAMVGSVTCNLHGNSKEENFQHGELYGNHGGYFIMNGKERIITAQMKRVYNRIVSFMNIDNNPIVEIRSFCEESAKSQLVQMKYNNKKTEIDIVIDMVTYKLQNIFRKLGHFEKVYDLTKASEWIPMDEAMFMLETLEYDETKTPDLKQLFPHMGIDNDYMKTVLLSKMLRKLVLCEEGVVSCDDQGNLTNKRVDTAGILCQDLFKMLWKQFIKSIIKESGKRKINNIISIINYKKKNITLNFFYCFATGTWGIKKNSYKKLGVSEFAQNKTSSLTDLGLLRKISIPVSKKDKNIKIRLMHPSSIFYLCPFETPEGASVGTRLTLSTSSYISLGLHQIVMRSILFQNGMFKDTHNELYNIEDDETLVLVNGIPVGVTKDHMKSLQIFNDLRMNDTIPMDCSVYYDKFIDIIEVWCDAGRFIRPLINTEAVNTFCESVSLSPKEFLTNTNNITFLENKNIIVYRDPLELEGCFVNPDWDFSRKSDYTEVDHSLVLGIVSGQIVFSNHTQSPRVCYMSNMIKQAMGSHVTHERRTDATVYSLDYVQKPLNTTTTAELSGVNDNPNGINAIVAVACYTGFNQEDSIILNKSSVDRGLFKATVKRTIVCEIKSLSAFEETIGIPPEENRLHFDYSKLDERGIIRVGTYVRKGDVVVAKTLCSKTNKVKKIEDSSTVVKTNEEGFVEKVLMAANIVKVCIVQIKIPEIGDKFCSGMAQKGTCGMMLNQEDMPFTSSGMVPDLIINPHCLPSRMTVNQLMSSLCSKARCVTGDHKFSNGNPFSGTDIVEEAGNVLEQNGFSSDGTETMYNGFTGKAMRAKIFIGPVYQHRLTHLVSNKIFSSVHTNVRNKLTRQPLNGRSNDGGLRIGEMEKDCLLRHGIVKFSNERLMDLSDKYVMNVCSSCKSYYHVTTTLDNKLLCMKCKTVNINSVTIPYAAKLLAQELEAMGLNVTMDA